MSKKVKIAIIGAGITGLSISHRIKSIISDMADVNIYEKDSLPGGLCKSFNMCGQWYDIGAHCEFAKDKFVRNLLESNVEFNTNQTHAINYKSGVWINNPVQNNLFSLSTEEKIKIIYDFVNKKNIDSIDNYATWLIAQYGKYFAENYPFLYTRKYWTVEPHMLETKWIGPRMYVPTLEEVLRGAFSDQKENVHYSGEIRYPLAGGFETFVKKLIDEACICYNKKLIYLDEKKKIMKFKDGKEEEYDYIILTTPLNESVTLFNNVPQIILKSAQKLEYTNLVLVSYCVNKAEFGQAQSIYIYDEDILATRVYSTNKYAEISSDLCAVQAEIYFSKQKPRMKSLEEIEKIVTEQLIKMGIIERDNIVKNDIREIEYANVLFTKGVYNNRHNLHSYLKAKEVYFAGRFADWEYMWSDQCVLSGKSVADKIIENIRGY